MRMKSYFAGSVQGAMEEARRELGGEAILVTSRLAPAEAGKPRQYEVVFAIESTETQPPRETRSAPPAEAPPTLRANTVPADSLQAVLAEIKRIRQDIQTWLPPAGDAARIGANSAKEFFTHLTDADVDPDLAQQLIAAAMKRLSTPPAPTPQPVSAASGQGRFADVLRIAASNLAAPATDLRTALAESITAVFRVDTGFANAADAPKVAALIGPPGAGKTAALAKLAVRYGLSQRKPAVLLSVDTMRIAASEQLRGYAAVLGMRFELASSTRALEQLLQEHRGYGLILIDTPGFTLNELNESRELVDFLATRTAIQKHLVLPAPARCADMSRMYSAFDVFKPSHLIFSRIDETTVFGPALSQTMGSGLPVSFFTTGPRVPEDISEASANLIADHILPASSNERGVAAAA
jgi:flagellar biosynthesis protein FlhF